MRTRCLPRGLQSQQLAAALAPLATTRVLHIADAPRAWAGWSDSAVGSCEPSSNGACGILASGPIRPDFPAAGGGDSRLSSPLTPHWQKFTVCAPVLAVPVSHQLQMRFVGCFSQEGEAAKRRMDVATFSWYHRSTKAAKASKRPDSEPYLWRPFKDLQVCSGRNGG